MTHEVDTTPPTANGGLRGTLIGAVALLAVLAAGVLLAFAFGDGTPPYLRAVAITATVCGSGSLAGWVIARRPYRSPAGMVAGGLAAIFFRLTLPLAALAWLQAEAHGLRDAGAGELLVGFYLLLLATDIVLNIMWSQEGRGCRRRKDAN